MEKTDALVLMVLIVGAVLMVSQLRQCIVEHDRDQLLHPTPKPCAEPEPKPSTKPSP